MKGSRLRAALRAHRAARPAPSGTDAARLMFVACSESVASAELLVAFPAAYVLQTLAGRQGDSESALRTTLEYGVLASGVRHVVLCGHCGCWGDEGAPTPEASQARVVARCRAMYGDEQLGAVLRRADVIIEALWFDEPARDVFACDLNGRPPRCLEDGDLAALFNRFDELSVSRRGH